MESERARPREPRDVHRDRLGRCRPTSARCRRRPGPARPRRACPWTATRGPARRRTRRRRRGRSARPCSAPAPPGARRRSSHWARGWLWPAPVTATQIPSGAPGDEAAEGHLEDRRVRMVAAPAGSRGPPPAGPGRRPAGRPGAPGRPAHGPGRRQRARPLDEQSGGHAGTSRTLRARGQQRRAVARGVPELAAGPARAAASHPARPSGRSRTSGRRPRRIPRAPRAVACRAAAPPARRAGR